MAFHHVGAIDRSTLTEVPESSVRGRWFVEYFDGPLAGVATADGLEYWYAFHSFADDAGRWFTYVLFALDAERLALLERLCRGEDARRTREWERDASELTPVAWFREHTGEWWRDCHFVDDAVR